MRRLRGVIVLLALGLLVPGVLLVRRALESVGVERAARHRTVAERIFDEMERKLSDFLEREEERPVGHYGYAWSPPGSPPGVRLRSPLADPPRERFVVGYFAIDADGTVHTPLRPRPGERPAGWPPPRAEALAAADRVLALARRAWPAAPPSSHARQKPGTTVAVGEGSRRDLEQRKRERDPERETAYDAIQALNLGAAQRSRRSQKVVPAGRGFASESVAEEEAGPVHEEALAWAAAPEPPPAPPAPTASALPHAPPLASDLAVAHPPARGDRAPPPPSGAPARSSVRRARAGPQLTIDPLQGFAIDDRHLVLHRTVWRAQRATRQGLILDVPGLEREVVAAALPAGVFPGARARLVHSDAAEPRPAGEGFHYRHRFAEPFQAFAVDLRLAPLAGASGERTIVLLSVLLLVAGSVGLFALDRMVAVVVAFSERRANFVAAVSHELKTPLTAIRMHAEMLRDGIVESEAKRDAYYETITAESERLSRLVDNVLEFSRLERGTREMSWVEGDLGALVGEQLALLSPHAQAQGFELVVELDPSLPPVRFDRDAVLQILFNLVDNAIKYARDARDRRIQLRCRRVGDQVELAVCDRGPGLPVAQRKRIFEPFYRGGSELTRSAPGAGIGLSLVRGLAQRMGARVEARGRSHGGLAVVVRFPIARDAGAAPGGGGAAQV